MTLVALFIAVLSLAVAVGHVLVDMITWRFSGHRVKVTWGWVFRPRGAYPGLIITAANAGRSPASIEGWGVRLHDGSTLVEFEAGRGGPQLPHRLVAQDSGCR